MGFPVEQIYRNKAGELIKQSTVQDGFAAKIIRESPRSWKLCDDGLGFYSTTKKGVGEAEGGIKSREFRFMTQDDVDEVLLHYDLIGAIPQV